jgi:hypothetical protein
MSGYLSSGRLFTISTAGDEPALAGVPGVQQQVAIVGNGVHHRTPNPRGLRSCDMEARKGMAVSLGLTRRKLITNSQGLRAWRTERADLQIPANRLAVVVCDTWDRHWSTGASLRVGQLAPRIDRFCRGMRDAGVLVIHAPSDTIEAYRDSPARLRIAGCGPVPR